MTTTQEPREGDQRKLWFPTSNGYSDIVATWTGYTWQIPTGGGGTLAGLMIGSDLFESQVEACKVACRLAELEVERREAAVEVARGKLGIIRETLQMLEATP